MHDYPETTLAALQRADYIDVERGWLRRGKIAQDIVAILISEEHVVTADDQAMIERRGVTTRELCERLIGLWDPEVGTAIAQALALDGKVQNRLNHHHNGDTGPRLVLCVAKVKREDEEGQPYTATVRFVASDSAPDTVMQHVLVDAGERDLRRVGKWTARAAMVAERMPLLAERIDAYRGLHAEQLRLMVLGQPLAIAAPEQS
jgi:hypothetical protein